MSHFSLLAPPSLTNKIDSEANTGLALIKYVCLGAGPK